MTRFFKGLAALTLLLAVVVGAPALLLRVGRLGTMAHLDWRQLLYVPDTGALLLAVMTLVAWAAWLVVLASVLAEVLALVTRQRLRVRIPGGGWVQPTVQVLVVAVAALVIAPSANAQVAHAAPPRERAAPTAPRLPTAPGLPNKTAAPDPTPEPVPKSAPASEPVSHAHANASGTVRHVVRPGEDLWSIAERYYGDGTQWRRIAADNHLSADDVLAQGAVLHLHGVRTPAAAPVLAPAAGDVATSHPSHEPGVEPLGAQHGGNRDQRHSGPVVRVRSGDSLSTLAARYLGDADRWPELVEANTRLLRDPDLIQPGWLLRLPDGRFVAAPSTLGSRPGGGTGAGTSQPSPRVTTSPRSNNRAEPSHHRPVRRVPKEASHVPQAQERRGPEAAGLPGAASIGGSEAPSPMTQSGSVAPHETAAPVTQQADLSTADSDALTTADLTAAAAMGTLLAAAVVGVLATRRRTQLARRQPGRRVVAAGAESTQFESALARVSSPAPQPPPQAGLTAIELGTGTTQRSDAPLTGAGGEADPQHDAANCDAQGVAVADPMLHDLEDATTTVVHGEDELVAAFLAAATSGLALQPWSQESRVLVVGVAPWLATVDTGQVEVLDDMDEAVNRLERLAAVRGVLHAEPAQPAPERGTQRPVSVAELREDPDRWEAWAPVVIVLATGCAEAQWQRVLTALAGSPLGLSVLAAGPSGRSCGAALHLAATDHATIQLAGGDPVAFRPRLVGAAPRRALDDLFAATGSDETTPAPWWVADDDLPPNLSVLPPRTATLRDDEEAPMDPSDPTNPTLLLLGPVDLVGCQGEPPSRARRQCVEYCAWIQLNPGRTATMMARQLLVAETTRRSNMSRLRSWLGSDVDGELYLPDAYSGRIQLHPDVSSDWEHLQLLIGPGVNRSSTDALVDALKLVRGAPLADAAPGQWHWAEELRCDMASTIRDIGVVLANRAIEESDLDLARWATARSLQASPGDEMLLRARIRTEHLAGNRPEVERLVLSMTRASRNLGVDLAQETVALMQEVMEGRRRAQWA